MENTLNKLGWATLAKGILSGDIKIHNHGYCEFHEYFKKELGVEKTDISNKIAPEFFAQVIRSMGGLTGLLSQDHYSLMDKYGTYIIPEIKWDWFGSEARTWILNKDNFLTLMKEEKFIN